MNDLIDPRTLFTAIRVESGGNALFFLARRKLVYIQECLLYLAVLFFTKELAAGWAVLIPLIPHNHQTGFY